MRCRERGMALVTMLFVLALLLAMALMFGDKVTRALRGTARTAARDQALQAAGAGIEWARHRLAATYATSAGWAAYLAAAPAGERYPETPVFSTLIDRVAVDIFMRDNPDGDDDPRHDNDLKLLILARARPAGGPDVLVESLCGLDPEFSVGYRQEGGDGRRRGMTMDVFREPPATPVATFQLQD